MEEEIIIPEEETFDYNKLRYILTSDGYICHASFGGLIVCDLGECTEYTGDVPKGYSTIEEWFDGEIDKLNAWKIVDDNLVFDENKYNELEQIHKIEEEENSCASKKYVNNTLKKSTAVVTDELATETRGNDLLILNDAGNYEIPYLKVKSDTVQNIKVVSSNKNILGISGLTTTINGVKIRINADGTITLNGVATEHIEFDLSGSITNKEMLFLIIDNIDYVISGLTNNVSLSLYSFDGTDRSLVGNYANELINLSSSYKITHVTLNISSGAEFKSVVIAPQIEIDNVATEFIKHEETKAYGILENNECTIEGLVSYKDKTIIMIDNDVESSIQYYRYKYINEKLVEIEINEEEVRSTLEEVNNTVEGQNQKISEVTQRVGELNSKISEIADITTSKESLNGKVEIEGINQSEPIYIKIHPTGENISYLYPHSNLFPSATLYPKVRTLRFTNTETNEIIDYKLPTDLLYYDDETYDEFILDYDMESCVVNKRVGYNIDGTTYALETPTTIKYEYPKIELTDGSYTVELLGYDNAYLFVRLMAQNIYTTQFATKTELHSEINQTVSEIDLSVDKKLTNYATTEEMNSAINVKADSITSSVSRTYATKTENANTLDTAKGYTDTQVTTAKSEIKQTTDSISSEVSKKVGNNEIISKINQSAEAVQINANKISLNGKEINLTSDSIAIKSTNFNVDTKGNMTCNNATFNGGVLDYYSSNGNHLGTQKSGRWINNETGNMIDVIKLIIEDPGDASGYAIAIEGAADIFQCFKIAKSAVDGVGGSGYTGKIKINDLLQVQEIATGYIKAPGTSTDSTVITFMDGISTKKNLIVDKDAIVKGTCSATTFGQYSSEKLKENIKKLNQKNKKDETYFLNKIKNTDICEYNFKNQKQKQLGLVIGEDYNIPDELIVEIEKDNEKIKGIDLYSMISMSWKAMQEQQQLIEQLQKEIQKLKKESE